MEGNIETKKTFYSKQRSLTCILSTVEGKPKLKLEMEVPKNTQNPELEKLRAICKTGQGDKGLLL
jgi:hypothetical protein